MAVVSAGKRVCVLYILCVCVYVSWTWRRWIWQVSRRNRTVWVNRDGKYKGNQRPEMAGTLCRQKKIMSDQQPTRPSCDLKFFGVYSSTCGYWICGWICGWWLGSWLSLLWYTQPLQCRSFVSSYIYNMSSRSLIGPWLHLIRVQNAPVKIAWELSLLTHQLSLLSCVVPPCVVPLRSLLRGYDKESNSYHIYSRIDFNFLLPGNAITWLQLVSVW